MDFLLKSNLNKPESELETGDIIEGLKSFIVMIDERLKVFGHGKSLKKELDLKLELIQVYLRIVETGDRFLNNTVKILKAQLEALELAQDEKEEYNEQEEIAEVFRRCGGFHNPKKVTVYEYELMKLSIKNG